MRSDRIIFGLSVLLLGTFLWEQLTVSIAQDDGVSINQITLWMDGLVLQKKAIQQGAWFRLFTWPFIHDLHWSHFIPNFFIILISGTLSKSIPWKHTAIVLFSSWIGSTLLFCILAPSNDALLGSSIWVYGILGMHWSFRKKTLGNEEREHLHLFWAWIGLGILAFSLFQTSNISRWVHILSYLCGAFPWGKTNRKEIPYSNTPKSNQKRSISINLIEKKIKSSGWDSLSKDERDIWFENEKK